MIFFGVINVSRQGRPVACSCSVSAQEAAKRKEKAAREAAERAEQAEREAAEREAKANAISFGITGARSQLHVHLGSPLSSRFIE